MNLPQKKLKQLNNNGVVVPMSNNRITKTKSEILGDIELKYVSGRDSIEFAKILQSPMKDRDFVVEILFHQIVNSKITFDDFKKLPNLELEELANLFVKNEKHTFKYFHDTGNYFKDFKDALAVSREKYIEESRKMFEPMVKSAQETLEAFNKNHHSVIQQSINGNSYIQEAMKKLAEVEKQIAGRQRILLESLMPAIKHYQAMAKIITESLQPQIDFWQKWIEQNEKLFISFSKYWADVQREYSIAEQKAVVVLQKYKWFITPSFPRSFIFNVVRLDKKKGRQDKAINHLFIKYFEARNWQNLEMMVKSWKNKPLLKKRYKILFDCVKVIKMASKKGVNEANVVLPTLITQIDGALTDYLNSKNIQWDCDYDDRIDSRTGKVKKIGRKTQFKNSKPKVLTTELDSLANDIFLNILFQRSQKGKPLVTPFNFNRHKIIHGESVKYGRKDYLIRAFMVLDLLAHL
jgi:hypothetical protein